MKINKVLIHNWYNLENQIVEFNPNTVIFGGNAVGKSSFADALQVALIPSKANFHFNSANHKQTNNQEKQEIRTLQSYALWRTGKREKETERTGIVNTYIIIEWESDLDKTTYLTGLAMCTESLDESPDAYWLAPTPNKTLSDIKYCVESDGQIVTLSLEEFQKVNGIKLLTQSSISGSKKYEDFYKIHNFNQWKTLFYKAMSVPKDISFNKYISEHLLNKEEIEIQKTQQDADEIKELNKKIAKNQKIAKDLAEVISCYDAYCSENKKYQKYCNQETYCTFNNLTDKNTFFEKETTKISARIKELKEEIDRTSSQIQASKELLAKYDTTDNPLIEERKNLTEKINSSSQKIEELKTIYLNVQRALDTVQTDPLLEKLNNIKVSISDTDKIVHEVNFQREREQNVLNNLEKEKEKINTSLKEQKENLAKLERSGTADPFFEGVEKFIELLKTDKNITASILKDHIKELKNEKYTAIIEDVLYAHAFEIYVSQRDYISACEYLKEYKDPNVNNIKIINVSLFENSQIVDSELYNSIIFNSDFLKKYINNILQNVQYDNDYVLDFGIYRKIVIRDYNLFGYETIKKNKEKVKNIISSLEETLTKNQNKVTLSAQKLHSLDIYNVFSPENIINYKQYQELVTNLKTLQEQLFSLEQKIKNNPGLVEIEEQRSKVKKELDSYQSYLKELNQQAGKIEFKKCQNEDALEKAKEELALCREKYLNLENTINTNERLNLEEYYLSLKKKNSSDEFIDSEISKLHKTVAHEEKAQQDCENKLVHRQEMFLYENQTYDKQDWEPGIGNIDKYKEEFSNLSRYSNDFNLELENHEQALEETLCNEVFSKISNNILKIDSMLKDINKQLKITPFKNKIIELKARKTGLENSRCQYFSDMFNKPLTQVLSNGLFANEFLNQYNEPLQEFKKILVSEDKELQNKILDYRNYRKIEIMLYNIDENGEKIEDSEICLSKDEKTKSAGENFAYCYVVLVSCLKQACRINDKLSDTIRFVIFDEVFTNIDGDLTNDLLEFFMSSGLQFLFITQPPYIKPYTRIKSKTSFNCLHTDHDRNDELAEFSYLSNEQVEKIENE